MVYSGWKNKVGTADRACKCGSWKNHWIKFSDKAWPAKCSVEGCNNSATVGAHVYNKNVSGEKIIPACDSCNKRTDHFSLKYGVTLVSANKSERCEKDK